MKSRKCRWACGRMTERKSMICVECIRDRDERNRRVSEGLAAYIPPSKRPGHRLYEGKPRTPAQLAGDEKRKAARLARKRPETTPGATRGGGNT